MIAEASTFSPLLEGSVYRKQAELEVDAVRSGIARYRRLAAEAVDRGEGAGLKPAERLIVWWMPALTEAIRQEQRAIRRQEPGVGREVYGPAMLAVDAEKIAIIALSTTLSKAMQFPEGMIVGNTAYSIGDAIVAEATLDLLRTEHKQDLKALTKKVRQLTVKGVVHWANKCLSNPIWNRKVCMHLGTQILWRIQFACSLPAEEGKFELAFRHKIVREGKREIGMVFTDPKVFEMLEHGHQARELLRPRYLPMLVPPLKWKREKLEDGSTLIEGGYVKISTPYVTKCTHSQKMALRSSNLRLADDCLFAVSQTPWVVNRAMVDIVNKCYRSGGMIGGLPRHDDIPRPERPDAADHDKAIHKAWKKEAAAVYKENARCRSDRIEIEHTLSVADKMSAHDRFYFPHQFDFRSRVYPIPQYLNHHGSDVKRSMLLFANSLKANKDDARWWLYVHAANCAGYDKISFEDRVKWVDEWIKAHSAHRWIGSMDSIVNCATETWSANDIDNPFQFLAAVLAIFSKDDAARIPIQFDATCNALQHYAAIAQDAEAAQTVNLIDCNAPGGIYGIVARRMASLCAIEAKDQKNPNRDIAALMANRIDKALSKGPTMTTNYGATQYGIHTQIFDALGKMNEREPDLGFKDYKLRHRAAQYLREVSQRAIASACPSSSEIMAWIKDSANKIADSGQAVRWTSPIGFPVVQPYHKMGKYKIKTLLQSVVIQVEDEKRPVLVAKQSRACAPNWVHSLDAAHALTSVLDAYNIGIDMAIVHDSFWMHAANADRCSQIVRDKFIALHSEDRLQMLADEWSRLYPSVQLAPIPEKVGTFNLENVRGAKYAFS